MFKNLLFILLLGVAGCKSTTPTTNQQPVDYKSFGDTSSLIIDNFSKDSTIVANNIVRLIQDGLILVDSCGVLPSDGTVVENPRILKIKERSKRKLLRINRKYDLQEKKVDSKRVIDSIRIITKVVYDTVKIKSIETVKVEEVKAKQAIKETRIEQSWKKWVIIGGFIFLFLLILVYLILKRYKIL